MLNGSLKQFICNVTKEKHEKIIKQITEIVLALKYTAWGKINCDDISWDDDVFTRVWLWPRFKDQTKKSQKGIPQDVEYLTYEAMQAFIYCCVSMFTKQFDLEAKRSNGHIKVNINMSEILMWAWKHSCTVKEWYRQIFWNYFVPFAVWLWPGFNYPYEWLYHRGG